MDMSTVGELIDYLATQPRDRKVILQKDAEGNGYSPVTAGFEAMYAAESTWSGQTYLTTEELTEALANPEYAKYGYTEENAAPDGAERVVLLVPVN